MLTNPSCLYHTFTILLYRPMLFQRSEITDQKPDPNHLVECISSATSIIAIFDLFCKTFGDNFCILSLSYSVYTAASIFLLQIQAGMSRDEQTLARLKFSIYSLERVKSTNPGRHYPCFILPRLTDSYSNYQCIGPNYQSTLQIRHRPIRTCHPKSYPYRLYPACPG